MFDFVPATDEVAIAAGEGRLEFVNLHTGNVVRELQLGKATTWFSVGPDGRRVAINGPQGIQVLNGTNGTVEGSWPFQGLVQRPGMAWTPDGRTLAVGGPGFDVVVLSVEPFRGEPVWLRGHSAEVSSLTFGPDGRWLATASWDSTTRLWDPVSGRLLLTQPEAGELTWTAGSRLVRWRNTDNDQQSLTVLKIDLPRACRAIAEIPPAANPENHKGPWVVECFADGRLIASPSYEGVRISDAVTGADLATLPTDHATSCTVAADPPSLLLTAGGRMIRWPFQWDPTAARLRFGRPLVVEGSDGAFVATADSGGRRLWASIGSGIRVWEHGTNRLVCDQPGRYPKPVVSSDGEWW
jgi:WD40 repeat protein